MKYEMVLKHLEKLIFSGKIKIGEKLPSENELAEIFGVTRMTVRRALIELEKDGIIFKIRGLGTFVSNTDILSSKKIGVLVHNHSIVFGIVKTCTAFGVKCYVEDIGKNVLEEIKSLKNLIEMKVNGLIVEPRNFTIEDTVFKDILESGLPIVFVDRNVANYPEVPTILSDNFSGAVELAKHMVEVHKSQNALFVTHENLEISSVKERYDGISSQYRNKVEILQLPKMQSNFSFVVKELQRNIDTIFFCNDILAVRGLTFLLKSGIRIPGNIRIAGFDDENFAGIVHPGLTTVRQDLEQVGSLAVLNVVKLFKGESIDNIVKIKTDLVVRNSCGCHH